MKPEALLSELEQAADRRGVKVSYERLHTSVGVGGLCRVRGQYRVIIDKRAGTNERVATLARALARLAEGEDQAEDGPALRELLRRAGAPGGSS